VLTSSRVSAALLQRDFGVATEQLHVVGNGLDTQRFCPDPSRARNPRELLCVARAGDPNKGVGTSPRCRGRGPVPLRRLWASSGGSSRLRDAGRRVPRRRTRRDPRARCGCSGAAGPTRRARQRHRHPDRQPTATRGAG
jgi:hypothetical protein